MRKHIQCIQSSFLLFFTLFALAACGGGGGSAPTNNIGSGGGSNGGGTGSGDDTDEPVYALNVGLYNTNVNLDDLDNSTTVTSVSTFGSAIFVARLTEESSGEPVEGAIISMSTTSGSISPGLVLTNGDGIAAAEIEADDPSLNGAATLTASIDDLSASRNFSWGTVDLRLGRDDNSFVDAGNIDFVSGEIDISLAPGEQLTANGTAVLRVVAVAADNTASGFSTPLTINFSSNCSNNGSANIDTGVTTVNGFAQAVYEANGCEGPDSITARIAELSGVTATGNLTVQAPDATSIRFVSATPEQISLKGTGDDQSEVVFQVLDGSGVPLNGEPVTLRLSSTVGGITLTDDADNDGMIQKISSGDGQVRVTVNSGAVPTSVRVEASISVGGSTVSTVSNSLVISTGLADQNSFEVVASVLNPGGDTVNGIETELTVFASDAFNNPVPDGTTINFVTEYGTVEPTCSTTNGTCTATWRSSAPRSPDNTQETGIVQTIFNTNCDLDGDGIPNQSFSGVPCLNPLSYLDTTDLDRDGDTTDYIVRNVKGGRSTVLAHAIGEESFVDANGSGYYDWIDQNGNGLYDPGEPLETFVDLPEAFIDHNDDGVFGNPLTGCDAYDGDGDADPTSNITTPSECVGARTGGQEETFVNFVNSVVNEYDLGNGIYNGTLCHPQLEAENLCTTDPVNVRSQVRILMAGETAYMAVYSTARTEAFRDGEGFSVYAGDAAAAGEDIDHSGGETILVAVSDRYNGYPPNGTSISVETDNCTLDSLESYTIGSTSSDGIFTFFIRLKQDESGEQDTGTVTVTAEVPESAGGSGQPNILQFTCNDEPVL